MVKKNRCDSMNFRVLVKKNYDGLPTVVVEDTICLINFMLIRDEDYYLCLSSSKKMGMNLNHYQAQVSTLLILVLGILTSRN